MPTYFLPFTGLAPSEEHGPNLVRCEGVIPALGGFRSLAKPTADGSVVDRIRSAYIHHWPAGAGTGAYTGDAATEFYGSIQNIYTYAAGTFTNVAGAVLSTNGSIIRFASFGNDIWATNYVDPVKRRTNNAGNFASGITSAFAPQARLIGVVRDFLVLGDINDPAYGPHWFAWSDFRDATYFSPRDATRPSSLASSQPITSRAGQLMAFVGGEQGTWWKRNSMHGMQFTGSDDVFRLDGISNSVGTPCPQSVVSARDGYHYFWGGDGFYRQAGMMPPERVGGDGLATLLIDRDGLAALASGLRALASFNDIAEEDQSMFGVEDPELGGIFWFYRDLASDPAVGNNRWIFYNYRTDTAALGSSPNVEVPGDTVGVNYSAAASHQNFLSTLTSPPRFVVGSFYDNVNATSYRFRFQGTDHHRITLATQRFAIEQDQAKDMAQHVAIEAVQPVLTPRQVDFDDYELAALPSNLQVKIVASNEPHFRPQLDSLGSQLSPRSATMAWTDANGFGWMGAGGLSGRYFLAELVVPEGSTALRGLRGLWIQYRVI